ncbi:hypothetical protein J2X31_002665 [Flavobacterium arsenatis]|uniref:Uncharacterized protein n=1 Tax=Flavobacterium arsenatis TaxID=1484332 RepID=A0ABU1TRZ3_9FLAO|nr:hypothetical protein [Flavobacterium arsenatis]MDR6968639.1 hypothetical protein [Flavobacterium arsenatis]
MKLLIPTAKLALMEMEILLLENVFFPDRKERPTEAPFVSWKKYIFKQKIVMESEKSS